jgi:hypothetical protein
MSKLKVKAAFDSCHVYVLGTTLACPLCGYVVQSGEQHECSRPATPPRRKRRPKASRP